MHRGVQRKPKIASESIPDFEADWHGLPMCPLILSVTPDGVATFRLLLGIVYDQSELQYHGWDHSNTEFHAADPFLRPFNVL